MLLSGGKVVFNGGVEGVKGWFGGLGYEVRSVFLTITIQY